MKTDRTDESPVKKNKELETLVNAKQRYRIPLLIKPNVIGMGVGQRTREGITTDELVVKVYVSRKLPKDQLSKEDLIPPILEFDNKKIKTDVEEADMPEAQLFTLRSRPLIGGSSIGPVAAGTGTGTLGVCITLDDNRTYILSNNHVLANTNRLRVGAAITQPSIGDGGTARDDTVATLFAAPPIDFGTTTITLPPPFGRITIPNRNLVDCALARVNNNFNAANREIHWIGYPTPGTLQAISVSFPFFNIAFPSNVCKMGRTSEFTVGKIVDAAHDTFVDYSAMFGNAPRTNLAFFEDQIRVDGGTRAFSQQGDSGSLVLDADSLRPVGLLFAGTNRFSFCNHINNVMRALNIPRI